jgi:nucleotide-binding universal stress UspA family protein
MSNSIALAIDFKKFTSPILETGLFLAKNLYPESKIVLFHVIEYFLTPPHYLLGYFKEEKVKLEKELTELSQKFKNENIAVENKVVFGNFWEALQSFIKDLNPYLLVLGYQPHRFKVTTSEKMLERLNCNFLVLKDKSLQKVEKILCCIDFSKASISSLKMANFISEKLKAELKVLNVIPEIKIKDKNILNKLIQEEKEKRKREWKNLINALDVKETELEIKYGDRIKTIVETVKDNYYDLLIIGKTGKMLNTGLGSITKELLKKIQIPILIVEKF